MNDKIMLWHHSRPASGYLKPYLLATEQPCGAVLIIPGGGYHVVCEPSEGAPVAAKFNALGLHAFVLNYRVAPDRFPAPQQDAMRALKIIRGRADEWKISPDQIGVCGFSAGGNLAATLGTTLVADVDASDGDRFDGFSARPDFIISGQGVLSFAFGRSATADNLLGKDISDAERMKFSPECCVDEHTPPAFLWTTFSDRVVDCRCSILFAQALQAHNVPCELHIFPSGDHGVLLGLDTPDVSQWPQLAKTFISAHTGKTRTPPENYTHAHQCEASHTYPGPCREEPR